MRPADADFGVTIDYVRGRSDPVQVFSAMADMLRGFAEVDRVLVGAVAPDTVPMTVIEDVEAASITTWLKNVLKKTDDQAIKEFDIKQQIGAQLVKAKYRVLEFLDKQEEKERRERQETLRRDLEAIGASANLQLVPPTIDLKALEPAMNNIQQGKARLTQGETVTVQSEVAPDFRLNVGSNAPVRIDERLQAEDAKELGGTMNMVLLIKKPDLIGQSQWEFRHGKTTIRANIEDEPWLVRFHEGKERLVPGAAMKATVRYAYTYDERGNLTETVYDVVKVQGLIAPTPEEQAALFGEEGDND